MSHHPLVKGISSRNLTCSGFLRVSEKMRVFQLHLVLALPGKLWSALSALSNLYDRGSTLLQPFDFPIRDLNWFLHEVEFFVDLDLFERDDESCISQTLLRIDT